MQVRAVNDNRFGVFVFVHESHFRLREKLSLYLFAQWENCKQQPVLGPFGQGDPKQDKSLPIPRLPLMGSYSVIPHVLAVVGLDSPQAKLTDPRLVTSL